MFALRKTYRRSVLKTNVNMAKNQPKEKRIRQIIDAAVLEFTEKGYEATSMESIARQAELSKGGLYHYFKSKDEILIEANNKFMEPILLLMDSAVKKKSACEGLKTYIISYLKHWSNHPRELKFTFLSIFKILSFEEMWPEMDKYINSLREFFKEMLLSGVNSGEFKKHDVDSRALALAASLDGSTPYLIMCENLTYSSIAEKLIKTFITEIENHE